MSIRRAVGSPTQHDEHPTTTAASRHGASRRSFVRSVGIGTAAAAGAIAIPSAVFATAAGAQGSTESELSDADTAIVTALEALEAAAVQSYGTALDIPSLEPGTRQLLSTYRRHHEAHLLALAGARGATGTESPTPADTAVSAQVDGEVAAARNDVDVEAQEKALYQAFYTLESNLAATFLVAVGLIEAITVTAVVIGIGPVNGQQAFYFGRGLGLPDEEVLPVTQPTDGAYPLPTA